MFPSFVHMCIIIVMVKHISIHTLVVAGSGIVCFAKMEGVTMQRESKSRAAILITCVDYIVSFSERARMRSKRRGKDEGASIHSISI